MMHVLDLDSSWFAMPPELVIEEFPDEIVAWENPAPPTVGTVLANVRVAGHTTKYHAWTDPPFVQVAEVLPINDDPLDIATHLPGAVRGGWAIRLEPADCPTCSGCRWMTDSINLKIWHSCPLCTRPPHIEGKALNQ